MYHSSWHSCATMLVVWRLPLWLFIMDLQCIYFWSCLASGHFAPLFESLSLHKVPCVSPAAFIGSCLSSQSLCIQLLSSFCGSVLSFWKGVSFCLSVIFNQWSPLYCWQFIQGSTYLSVFHWSLSSFFLAWFCYTARSG